MLKRLLLYQSLPDKTQMRVHKCRQLMSSTKIDLVPSPTPSPFDNPEQSATFSLLQISNQQFDFLPFQIPHASHPLLIPEKQSPKNKPQAFQRTIHNITSLIDKSRLSVADKYTECHKMARKSSFTPIINLQQPYTFKRNAINPSHFLLFQNGRLDNLHVVDLGSPKKSGQNDKSQQKFKPPKNIASFIRRRNQSLIKQQENIKKQQLKPTNSTLLNRAQSPTLNRKMAKSCQLTPCTKQEPISPIKIQSPTKIQEGHYIQFRCTSPTFKHRRYLNYHQLRHNNPQESKRPCP